MTQRSSVSTLYHIHMRSSAYGIRSWHNALLCQHYTIFGNAWEWNSQIMTIILKELPAGQRHKIEEMVNTVISCWNNSYLCDIILTHRVHVSTSDSICANAHGINEPSACGADIWQMCVNHYIVACSYIFADVGLTEEALKKYNMNVVPPATLRNCCCLFKTGCPHRT